MTLLGCDDPLTILEKDSVKIRARYRGWLFSLADIVVSISPALSKAYKKAGFDDAKLRLIANPVDTGVFSPPTREEKAELRYRHGVDTNGPVLVFVGSIIERKGVDFLIEAFAKVQKKYTDALFMCIGSKDFEPEFVTSIEERLEELKLEQKVIFTGLVDNVYEYLKAADIFVFASSREGLPNVLLEAMASGLPVVTTNIDDTTEVVIKNGEDGFIVSRNSNTFASKIVSLLDDRKLYKEISGRAVEKIQRSFNIEKIDTEYKEVYRSQA